jgi:hypothetical protein
MYTFRVTSVKRVRPTGNGLIHVLTLVKTHGAGIAGPALTVAGIWQWSPAAACVMAGATLWAWDVWTGWQSQRGDNERMD